MEIVVSGTSGELADFTERMIGVHDVSSQKPYEAKPGYVPLSDWKDMIRAAPSATRDTTSAPPSGAGLSDGSASRQAAPPTVSNPENPQTADEQD